MTRAPRRGWLWAGLGAAVVALAASVTMVAAASGATSGGSSSFGGDTTPARMMGGVRPGSSTSMMGGVRPGSSTSMMGGVRPGSNTSMMGGVRPGSNTSMMGGVRPGSSTSMMGGVQPGSATSMMGGGGLAGRTMGHLWLTGDGVAVTSIASARQRAARAAAPFGLHPAEIIWFDNGFYVELKDTAGTAATEVLIDEVTGAVTTEPGPAMMWNTRYGMHSGGAAPASPLITGAQAQQTADRWLRSNLPGRVAGSADAYPGYYTIETSVNGAIEGMLSVNAATGTVWMHTWHGRFLAKEDS
jgi:hypothetical protein